MEKKAKCTIAENRQLKKNQLTFPPQKTPTQNPNRNTNTLLKYKIHTIFSNTEFLPFSIQRMDERKQKPCRAQGSRAIWTPSWNVLHYQGDFPAWWVHISQFCKHPDLAGYYDNTIWMHRRLYPVLWQVIFGSGMLKIGDLTCKTLSFMWHVAFIPWGCLAKTTIPLFSTYRSRAELKAGEKQDLSHQDSKGQIGMDMIALVADGADRPGRTQKDTWIKQHSKKHEHIYNLSASILIGFWSFVLMRLSWCLLSTPSTRMEG